MSSWAVARSQQSPGLTWRTIDGLLNEMTISSPGDDYMDLRLALSSLASRQDWQHSNTGAVALSVTHSHSTRGLPSRIIDFLETLHGIMAVPSSEMELVKNLDFVARVRGTLFAILLQMAESATSTERPQATAAKDKSAPKAKAKSAPKAKAKAKSVGRPKVAAKAKAKSAPKAKAVPKSKAKAKGKASV